MVAPSQKSSGTPNRGLAQPAPRPAVGGGSDPEPFPKVRDETGPDVAVGDNTMGSPGSDCDGTMWEHSATHSAARDRLQQIRLGTGLVSCLRRDGRRWHLCHRVAPDRDTLATANHSIERGLLSPRGQLHGCLLWSGEWLVECSAPPSGQAHRLDAGPVGLAGETRLYPQGFRALPCAALPSSKNEGSSSSQISCSSARLRRQSASIPSGPGLWLPRPDA